MAGSISGNFGGPWSDAKLHALGSYLKAYTKVLKNQPFKLIYLDAFAGAGVRPVDLPESDAINLRLDEEEQNYRHGSPLIALSIEPPFHRFVFIDKDNAALESLRSHIEEQQPTGQREIEFLAGDANEQIRSFVSRTDWFSHRAVAFLDPFALQVDWTTLEVMARTQAVDLWLLFPAMGVNRMLTRSGEIQAPWRRRLDRLFGIEDWDKGFYAEEQPDLFGESSVTKIPRVFETLSDYVTARLGTIFAKTHKTPLILKNRKGAPLFLLCFASANPGKGSRIAVNIAQDIIDSSNHG
ncbi:MAG: three-Cys-motif partner protein TcmP [Opitutales bacterium]